MQSDNKIFRLEGVIQHYAWGGKHFIPALLHRSNQEAKPFAEYWLGAHDSAPAVVDVPGRGKQKLNTLIQEDPGYVLGKDVSERFGRLPYLLKILDVADMLSIQVNPEKKSAKEAFEAENEKRIPLDDPGRNYKDANHKPELMVALSDFWLLHGFKPKEKLLSMLNEVPELTFLADIFNDQGYRGLYKTVMDMTQDAVNNALQPLLARLVPLYQQEKLSKEREDFWAARAALSFNSGNNIDRGIFSIYFFNLVYCRNGEAVFQDAGIPHAYLQGQNVEIMANSDNVLRGGLTSKHIDVGELMKHIKFEGTRPALIQHKKRGNTEEVFETPAADFELSYFKLHDKVVSSLTTATAEVFFVEKGSVNIKGQTNQLTLAAGEAAIVFSDTQIQLSSAEESQLFRATVPAPLVTE